jgi:DedD protein
MAFPPFSKRGAPGTPRASGPAVATELDEPARARARRRLIGAAVLLVVGIIAFPVLFETQPRPVPVDIPMVIPSREGAAPLAPPQRPARTASGLVSEAPPASSAPAGVPPTAAASGPVQVPAAAPAGPAPAARPAPPASRVASGVLSPAPAAASAASPRGQTVSEAAKPAPPPVPQPSPQPSASPAAAKAVPAAPAVPPAPTVPDGKGRFVVQVGAYADEASARTVRQRIERLGLKTYTQEVEVQGQRRIRVRIGPFETQQQAAKVLDTLKSANLPGAVLAL